DTNCLDELARKQVPLIVYEESAMVGGLGTAMLEYYNETNQTVVMKRLGVPDLYVQHGNVNEVLEELHLSLKDIKEEIKIAIKK
ncbi:MAG: transketolase C-terminal domain-containing protein, partial [Turicibacter sp.]|nr:transketolase C-terminal domain-containing protein [Turicibacter sp.]